VYRTSAELRLSQLELNMRLVREKRQSWDWRWSPIRSNFDPVWAYIMYLEGRDIVQSLAEMHVEQPTYLRHGDDHRYQFMVKDDGSLAGVVDWEL
jgi:aminoglycoside phosphotransferase (APT) family kinase protein